MVRTCWVFMPVSTTASRCMVRVRRPAPVSRTTETAICATTNERCNRCRFTPPVARLPPAASASPSLLSRVSVGAKDSSTATKTTSARVKASTAASTRISPARGLYRAAKAINIRTPPNARRRPSAPPATARTRFSANSRRRSRPVPAPNAARTVSSCSRRTPRMRVTLVTLAQTMIRTKAAAPMSTRG